MYLARLMAFWPAALFVSVPLSAHGGLEHAPAPVEVHALERESYGRLTVAVTIGGEGPYEFMVDTGAQATVLSTSLANRLGLDRGPSARVVGMAGSSRVETAALQDIGLGSRRFDLERTVLVPQTHIGEADGILGLDSVQGKRVLLDFVNNTVTIADGYDSAQEADYDIVVEAGQNARQLVIADARLNGVKTAVMIDTGAYDSVGNLALLKSLRGARYLGQREMADISGQRLLATVRLGRELDIGRARVRNVPILFADAPPFGVLGLKDKPALILGMKELKRFRRVAIDFGSRRVLFDAPGVLRAAKASVPDPLKKQNPAPSREAS